MIKNENEKLYKILYYVSIMLIPNFFLFNVYNQNYMHIQLNHVLILACILSLLSLIGAETMRILLRSREGCVFITLASWTAFWFFDFFRLRLRIQSGTVLFSTLAIVLILIVILLFFISNKLQKISALLPVTSGIIILLLLFNVFPIFIRAINTGLHISDFENDWEIRRDFVQDMLLESPDIYWFHMDGMISIHNAEYYFDLPQTETRKALLDLGFVINEKAELAAGSTNFGVAALLSPNFYDSFLHEIFIEGSMIKRDGRTFLYDSAMHQNNISFINDIAPYHEFLHAFLQNGYIITMIADFDPNVYTLIDQFYRLSNSNEVRHYPFAIADQTLERHSLLGAFYLVELLTRMTPIPRRVREKIVYSDINWQTIPTYYYEINKLTATTLDLVHEGQLYQVLIDHLNDYQENAPSLTYITLMFTHVAHWTRLTNEGRDNSRIDLYPLAHEYALNVMFNMIDMILEQNPYAVIVIQAEHGIHMEETQEALLEAGFTEEEVIRLFNSVISAVRIPERYGGLDAPLAPLNITRELVNRFVGENYELLPD